MAMNFFLFWWMVWLMIQFGSAISPVKIVDMNGNFKPETLQPLMDRTNASSKVCFVSNIGRFGSEMETTINSIFRPDNQFDSLSSDQSIRPDDQPKPQCLGSVSSLDLNQNIVLLVSDCATHSQYTMALHGRSDMLLHHICLSDIARHTCRIEHLQAVKIILNQYYETCLEEAASVFRSTTGPTGPSKMTEVSIPLLIVLYKDEVTLSHHDNEFDEIKKMFESEVSDLWHDIIKESQKGQGKITPSLDISWHVIEEKKKKNGTLTKVEEKDTQENTSHGGVQKLHGILQAKLKTILERSQVKSNMVIDVLTNRWEKGISKPVKNNLDRDHFASMSDEDVFLLESASRKAEDRLRGPLLALRDLADKGEIKPHFGALVTDLVDEVLNTFDISTRSVLLHSVGSHEQRNIIRSQLLNDYIYKTIHKIQSQMVLNVKHQSVLKLNQLLRNEVSKLKDPRLPLDDVVVTQYILQPIELKVKKQLADLMIPWMSGSTMVRDDVGEDETSLMVSSYVEKDMKTSYLKEYINAFEQKPETKSYRRDLFAIWSQKHATMPKKKPGISPKLNLVGFLCMKGNGNFNWYGNFALGTQSSILLGMDNTHRGEDDPRPMLTFQPKLHFDVDV